MVARKVVIIGISCVVIVMSASIAVTIYYATADLRSKVTVETADCGKISGTSTPTSPPVYQFYNIPYAVPPVGQRRFQPAELLSGTCWDGTLDASKKVPVMCVQMYTPEGTEDCLVLSVLSRDLSLSKPVIVWIHGGGLSSGWYGQEGYSFDTSMVEPLDAVLVNINYRLGYLGFNALEETRDETNKVYANNGVRDIATALSWINKNIASFGGDPASVTLIGESGGGTAILGLLGSPLANNLFHKAISLSPAPEIRFDYTAGDAKQRFVATAIGCTQATLAERRQCLLDASPYKFTTESVPAMFLTGMGYFNFPLRYGAAAEYTGLIYTDPTVIEVNPRNLKDASFTPTSKVKVILSSLAQETGLLSQIDDYKQAPNLFPDEAKLRSTLELLYKNITSETTMVEKTFAMYDGLDTQNIWDTLTSDMRFTCPTNDIAAAMAQSPNHDVYRLYISNSMQFAPINAFHGWDTFTLFGWVGELYFPGPRDLEFRGELVSILKEFAADGTVSGGWSTYPANSLTLGNGSPMSVTSEERPQDTQCSQLEKYDLVKYGAQN